MTARKDGRSGSGEPSGLRPFGAEPAAQSQAKPLVPNAVSVEIYALGLLAEEMGEAVQVVGKGLRFGVEARGPSNEQWGGRNARECLPIELGDVLAAIDYAEAAGLVDGEAMRTRARQKLGKLLSADSLDAQGNRLAPDPAQAIEARRVATGTGAVEDESAVPKGCAQ